MRPKAENVFDSYDLEVLRTWKVRSAILCEAKQGIFILKEFNGHGEKLLLLNTFLTYLKEQGFSGAEMLIPNKEGNLLQVDPDGTKYIVKTYVNRGECSPDSMEDCKLAMRALGCYHKIAEGFGSPVFPGGGVLTELEKHNKELKKVRRYLKEKGKKNSFEHFLNSTYDRYFDMAQQVVEELKNYPLHTEGNLICHGDFQYHNVLLQDNQYFLINFEKCIWDNKSRDIYHFMSKFLEKNNWSPQLGEMLLQAYESENKISEEDTRQLYFRFCYPEKFWKIVNYYYNSRKAFIPEKNREKLELVLSQENKKKEFIEKVM